jgi:phage baseplate assembly protein W
MATYFGIKFPFGKSTTAIPAPVEDLDLIKDSLIQIVTTGRGERIMRPDFGSSAFSFIFENNNVVLSEMMRDEITTAIAKFEPRVVVRDVLTEKQDNEVVVTILYIVNLTGQQDFVEISTPAV